MPGSQRRPPRAASDRQDGHEPHQHEHAHDPDPDPAEHDPGDGHPPSTLRAAGVLDALEGEMAEDDRDDPRDHPTPEEQPGNERRDRQTAGLCPRGTRVRGSAGARVDRPGWRAAPPGRRRRRRLTHNLAATSAMIEPISLGFWAMRQPAPSRASIFAAAVPLLPEMIAPAWPIFLPDGAVRPAMYATTGFFICCFMNSAASSSAEPPISPIMITAPVSGSASKAARASMKLVPGTGSPPIPTQVVCPIPRCVISCSAWYVNVPDRLTIPTGPPPMAISPAVMPMLHLPGEMIPGQL